MNKYKRNMDEEQLAKSIDDVRKTFCNDDCMNCPWSMGDEKYLLITAENHISDRYKERYRNLMKHYGEVNDFIMNTDHIMFGDYELSRVDADEWILYRNRVVHYELRDVTSALELIRMVKK